MAMTAEEARRHLEIVDEGLRNAADQLVATPSRTGDLTVQLELLAGIVREVYANHSSLPQDNSLLDLVRRIQSRASRVQLLLDNAMNFYCGAMSAVIPHSCAYTPSGEVTRQVNGGYLEIRG